MKNDFCKGHIIIHNLPSDFNKSGVLKVEVGNRSKQDWTSTGDHPVNICYHWLDENWNMVVFDGPRSTLGPNGVAAGTSGIFSAKIAPVQKPGIYYLMLTLVREKMYWFDGAEGFHMATVKIWVEEDAILVSPQTEPAANPPNPGEGKSTRYEIQDAGHSFDQSVLGGPQGSDYIRIKPYEKNRHFGFMHIHKTSGTAMRSFLIKVMDLKSYYDKPDRSMCTSDVKAVSPVFPKPDNYLAHTSLDSILKGCPDGQYLTVFREASSRILSHWLFWRSSFRDKAVGSNRWENLVMRCRGKLVDVLLDPELACQFDNASLRMLVWPHPAIPDLGLIDEKYDEELLHAAFERLKKFSYLDIVENPQFESNLKDWLGTTLDYSRTNVAQPMPEKLRVPLHKELSSGAMEALERTSRLDRVLWTAVAKARSPGIDIERLTRKTLTQNIARYSAIMS